MEEPHIEALLDTMQQLRDGFEKQLDVVGSGQAVVKPPAGLETGELLRMMRETADDLTSTLTRYGRS